jgi:hypothetical protein
MAGYHIPTDKIAVYHGVSEKAEECYSASDKITEYHLVTDKTAKTQSV